MATQTNPEHEVLEAVDQADHGLTAREVIDSLKPRFPEPAVTEAILRLLDDQQLVLTWQRTLESSAAVVEQLGDLAETVSNMQKALQHQGITNLRHSIKALQAAADASRNLEGLAISSRDIKNLDKAVRSLRGVRLIQSNIPQIQRITEDLASTIQSTQAVRDALASRLSADATSMKATAKSGSPAKQAPRGLKLRAGRVSAR
jgi:uncharacterized phage infection (PIP) family protein YhgE